MYLKLILAYFSANILFNSSLYADDQNITPTQNNEQGVLDKITPTADSSLEKKFNEQKKMGTIPNFVSLYKLNYVLPYYYTSSPYDSVYQGFTPNNQQVQSSEFKGQISVEVPLIKNLFYNEDMSINGAFTELIYWQFYAESQYFRETDAEATLFFKYHFHQNWLFTAGFDHQSNGKGGELERSWNRVIGSFQFSGENFYVQTEFWGLVFQAESSDLHNPGIERYLGHEDILYAYKFYSLTASMSVQNLESGMERGNYTFSLAYPVSEQLNFYAQYFNGYGQSLIEYDHRTQGAGIGVSFNNFL